MMVAAISRISNLHQAQILRNQVLRNQGLRRVG